MPVNVRVDVPDFKAEVDLNCDLHGTSFWHLKLCLVDWLLSLHKNAQITTRPSNAADRERRPLMQLVANTLKGRRQDNGAIPKSCMPIPTTQLSANSIVPNGQRVQRRQNSVVSSSRCHSSASSLSLSDKSTSSQTHEASNLTARSSCAIYDPSFSQNEAAKSSSCYYGFGRLSFADWDDDNARQSNDLSDEEDNAAAKAIVMATGSPNSRCFEIDAISLDANHKRNTSSQFQIRRMKSSPKPTEKGDNVYECLRFSEVSADSETSCDRTGELDVKPSDDFAKARLFEQLLHSGFLNYGFYSFSLARFIDDQTNLTEYLTLVSSSTGASYYLDLEFKLKRRQQSTSRLLKKIVYASTYDTDVDSTHYSIGNGLSLKGTIKVNNDAILLKPRRLHSLSFNSLGGRMKRSTSNCSDESRASQSTQHFEPSSTNNMIAKLASNTGASAKSTSSSQTPMTMSLSQSKRKRSKLIDLLLNTSWSKQSQQATNLMKLNKILLACDANFLDEKTGESPLSLIITAPQINETQAAVKTSRSKSTGNQSAISSNGCPQSTSLFDLQSQHQTVSHNLLTLHQTSANDICQSKAPIVERILLLLIKSGALIDFRNNDGRTPLHIAAKVSNFWALKTLLDLEASPDAADINGLTPLFYSILHKAELKVTQLLLNRMSASISSYQNSLPDSGRNTHVEIIDQHGWQAIHYAAKFGLSGHLDKLLYYGCDINAKIIGSGNTPLHVAAINDQLEIAKVLLLRGADRTITNNSHQTAHQTAVISNNMNLAEFIASHDDTKVVPFSTSSNSRPNAAEASEQVSGNLYRLSVSSSVQQIASRAPSMVSYADNNQRIAQQSTSEARNSTAQSMLQNENLEPSQLHHQPRQPNYEGLNPLTLDVVNDQTSSHFSGPTTNVSGASQQALASLLSIDSSCIQNNQMSEQLNISPSLSKSSCGTSNTTTTSSSGVCCDAVDGVQPNEHPLAGSKGRQSNVTIITIGNNGREICNPTIDKQQNSNYQRRLHCFESATKPASSYSTLDAKNDAEKSMSRSTTLGNGRLNQQQASEEGFCGQDEDEDISGSESSSDELYSLMSDRKPIYVGSKVRAANCYESGDPKHLQLRRDDLVEILDCPIELIRDGQLPRLANKPMLYGRRLKDGVCGLFPSFCVRRMKQKLTSLRQPMQDVINMSKPYGNLIAESSEPVENDRLPNSPAVAVRLTNLPASQSMVSFEANFHRRSLHAASRENVDDYKELHLGQPSTPATFVEFQVTLTKINEGFGFVLRGAKIDPTTLADENGANMVGRISLDERLMVANRLASLQYFSDIEPNSIAHQNGLKRGDFLVSVNNCDVRLCSHEQVVQMIRQSGDRVFLTIARSAPLIMGNGKTLSRVKPEPPKRDPTTTLTRNKTMRVKSVCVAPQLQKNSSGMFDHDKPLPSTPQNGTSSPMGLNRSVSSNLSHFSSANSLSSGALDAQSISSISTLSSIQAPDSSSSTATLTTVATSKPKLAPKSEGIQTLFSIENRHNENPFNQSASSVTSERCQSHATGTNANEVFRQGEIEEPQLPPAPPPLPDFSTPTKDRLNQRRTSAPINQVATNKIDKDRLMKKRESLAAVSIDSRATAGNPAPICAVAAACAAAANNRLQRQLQRQQTQQQQVDRKSEDRQEMQKENEATKLSNADEGDQEPVTPTNEPSGYRVEARIENPKIESDHKISKPSITRLTREHEALSTQKRDTTNQHLLKSATLGRKSSAQIIQQPKQGTNISQSQTLKISSAKQRIGILDYDSQIFVEQKRPAEESLQQAQRHQRYNDQQQVQSCSLHNKQQNLSTQNQPNKPTIDKIERDVVNQIQDQQTLMRQQQLRQRQIQEQIRLQQIHQHRCQHGTHNNDYNSQLQIFNQSHVYQAQRKHSNQPASHHHSQTDSGMTMSMLQQYQHQQLAELNHHQHSHQHRTQQQPHHHHNHHQHHHHHHRQQAHHRNHRQQIMTNLGDQAAIVHHNQLDHYNHYRHQERIPQCQFEQQQCLQNVNTDPRLTAINR